jgi:hypothetical protein
MLEGEPLDSLEGASSQSSESKMWESSSQGFEEMIRNVENELSRSR